jgi:hypothetical protein
MKVTDIDIGLLLYTPDVSDHEYDHGEDSKGLFKKHFLKKKKPEVPFFNTRVEEFGRDALYDDINEKYDAYIVKGAPLDTMVVLSRSYLILPGKEIFPLYDVFKFAIQNESCYERPYEQYAIDRFDEPYDPDFISEYDNEEGFELDRFNIRLRITDKNNLVYDYVFPMEVADRRDFREQLNDRLAPVGAHDFSDEDVMEGRFTDDEPWQ